MTSKHKRQEKECGICVNKKDCVATNPERLLFIYWTHLCRDAKRGFWGIALLPSEHLTRDAEVSSPFQNRQISQSIPYISQTITAFLLKLFSVL